MRATALTPLWEVTPVLSDRILISPHVTLDLGAWVPGLYRWQPIEQTQLTTSDGQPPITFHIDTIDFPSATQRWKVSFPGHPEVTFDDLRAGKWPEATEQEMETRRKALELAREVREKFDIRPLTTATIIRQLRGGEEIEDSD